MKKKLVEVTVFIGGNLQRSKLNTFINRATSLYKEVINNPQNSWNYIRETIDSTCIGPLILKTRAPDGEIDDAFVSFCSACDLSVKVEIAPFIDQHGNYRNNMLQLACGFDSPISCIPLDGQANTTTLVESVFVELDNFFNEYEKPLKEAPLSINDNGHAGEIARRKLSGEPLRKILTEVLKSRIDYPDTAIPDFKLI